MRLRCGFQPLWDRLIYIRHMSFVRPAVNYYMNPNWVRSAIYFGLNANRELVYTTDKRPTFNPSADGKFVQNLSIFCFF